MSCSNVLFFVLICPSAVTMLLLVVTTPWICSYNLSRSDCVKPFNSCACKVSLSSLIAPAVVTDGEGDRDDDADEDDVERDDGTVLAVLLLLLLAPVRPSTELFFLFIAYNAVAPVSDPYLILPVLSRLVLLLLFSVNRVLPGLLMLLEPSMMPLLPRPQPRHAFSMGDGKPKHDSAKEDDESRITVADPVGKEALDDNIALSLLLIKSDNAGDMLFLPPVATVC